MSEAALQTHENGDIKPTGEKKKATLQNFFCNFVWSSHELQKGTTISFPDLHFPPPLPYLLASLSLHLFRELLQTLLAFIQ